MSVFADNCPPPRSIEMGYILLFTLLPWSVDCGFGSWNLMLPAEPLILLLGLGLALTLAHSLPDFFLAVRTGGGWFLLWTFWQGLATMCSTLKTVSLKFWLVEAGHIWVFGFGMLLWPKLWHRVLPYFLLSMLGLVGYTVVHHSMYSFRADQAILSPMPFFPDHTMYAAVLAVLIFYGHIQWEGQDVLGRFFQKRWVQYGVSAIFFAGILVSTSRAALLSFGFAAAVFAGFFYRKRSRYIAIAAFGAAGVMLSIAGVMTLDANTRDVSVLERLNRWDCAASMLSNRPITGYGPGTFQFQYLPFQQPEKMTRISLDAPLPGRGPDTYGRGGGAHSEYWQSGAELGWPGLVLWLALVFGSLRLGLHQAIHLAAKTARRQALWTSLGLLTYFIHALANNFLHDARLAALIWGGVALLGLAQKRKATVNRSATHQ